MVIIVESVGFLVADDGEIGGTQDDLDVEQEGPVLKVEDIEPSAVFEVLLRGEFAPVAGDLGESGDAWSVEVSKHVSVDDLREVLGLFEHERSRSDDGHIAQEHVDELRRLVEIGLAQEGSDLGDSSVTFGSHLSVGSFVGPHGSELQAREGMSVLACPFLSEEDGTLGFNLDGEGDDEENGDEYREQENQGEDEVE